MSLKDCIGRGRDGGEMEPGRANEAEDLFDELEAEARRTLSPEQAVLDAGRKTREILGRQAAEKRRQMLIAARRAAAIERNLNDYRNSKGEEDFSAAAMALLDRDEFATYSNVEARRKALLGRFHGRMVKVLETFRRDLVGRVRNRATLENMTREVFGEDSGDQFARELAKAWGEAAEFARLKFNAAGGRIAKRADWGMPQFHDPLLVRKASFEEWRDFIEPRLNRDRMIDETTGIRMSDGRLELALRQVYETVSTDGFSKLKPTLAATGGRKLANRHADHRFISFRDADAWLQYQERFGAGEPFSIMVSHLDRMARDIAQLEILGPNPPATIRFIRQTVEKRAAELDGAQGGSRNTDRARRRLRKVDEMFAHITGAANAPIDGLVGRSFAGLRSVLTSAQLGAATISAITDVNFQRLAAKHNGLSQVGTLRQVVRLLTPSVTEHQRIAVGSGLIADGWSTVGMAQMRYVGEISGPEFTRRLSDFVLRVSGLSPWTQAGRWGFGMEFMQTLGLNAERSFDDLPEALQRTFNRYGFDSQAWDEMRGTALFEHEGAVFLRPDDIAARDNLVPGRADALATRVLEMIQTETEFAVPTSSLRGRVALVSDAPPGTFQGELLRSFAMYKNFAVTLMHTHIARAVAQKGALKTGQYAADLVIGTTLMGALALQLKDIAKGQDPRSMVGDKAAAFWGAAMIQGGGLGIFGDFLFADLNRADRGLAETIVGPVGGFFNDVRRLTLGNLAQLPGERDTNFGREATNFFRRYTPGGSLWYLRLGLDRLLFDQLQEAVDPGARRSFRRRQSRARSERGQRYFFRPGQTVPDRFPNLAAALEAR